MFENFRNDEKILIGASILGIGMLFFSKKTPTLNDAYWGNYDSMDRFKGGFKPIQPIIDPELITEDKEAKIRRFIKKNKELAGDMSTHIGLEGSIFDQFLNWLDSTYYGKESKYVGVKPRNSKFLKHDKKVYDSIIKTKAKLPKDIDFPMIFQVIAEDKQYAQWERKKAETEANIRRINRNINNQ